MQGVVSRPAMSRKSSCCRHKACRRQRLVFVYILFSFTVHFETGFKLFVLSEAEFESSWKSSH